MLQRHPRAEEEGLHDPLHPEWDQLHVLGQQGQSGMKMRGQWGVDYPLNILNRARDAAQWCKACSALRSQRKK